MSRSELWHCKQLLRQAEDERNRLAEKEEKQRAWLLDNELRDHPRYGERYEIWKQTEGELRLASEQVAMLCETGASIAQRSGLTWKEPNF